MPESIILPNTKAILDDLPSRRPAPPSNDHPGNIHQMDDTGDPRPAQPWVQLKNVADSPAESQVALVFKIMRCNLSLSDKLNFIDSLKLNRFYPPPNPP